ncbi:hypothetical protein B0H34DRAFT_676149 [Crassisporium funariophilum]|nr:hypothetical protein B0H34DRAFT_676149 [Crassisporium funariophilum]
MPRHSPITKLMVAHQLVDFLVIPDIMPIGQPYQSKLEHTYSATTHACQHKPRIKTDLPSKNHTVKKSAITKYCGTTPGLRIFLSSPVNFQKTPYNRSNLVANLVGEGVQPMLEDNDGDSGSLVPILWSPNTRHQSHCEFVEEAWSSHVVNTCTRAWSPFADFEVEKSRSPKDGWEGWTYEEMLGWVAVEDDDCPIQNLRSMFVIFIPGCAKGYILYITIIDGYSIAMMIRGLSRCNKPCCWNGDEAMTIRQREQLHARNGLRP